MKRQDILNLAVLLTIGLAIGVYMVMNTVLISQDGVFYIESAQKIFDSPTNSIKRLPPGFAFIIAGTHSLVSRFIDTDSLYVWIYSAQSITLLCRLLALVPIYFIGKILVGAQRSFWSVLILIFLPYPAQVSCEIVRDWPHILFLMTGFLCLMKGAKDISTKWWLFGIAGAAAGLGFIIRHECAQLLFYGIVWLIIMIFKKRSGLKLPVIAATILFVVAFLITSLVYLKARGDLLLPEFKSIIRILNISSLYEITQPANSIYAAVLPNTGLFMLELLKSLLNIFEAISENLAYAFIPFVILGIFHYFKSGKMKGPEVFFLYTFIFFNCLMLILLDSSREYVSKRHCLPLTIFLVLYIPAGLETMACWSSRNILPMLKVSCSTYFWILLVICFISCLPKLLRPVGSEKLGYRAVAEWLIARSPENAFIAVPDKRISFYAMRKGVEYERKSRIEKTDVPSTVKYIVLLSDKHRRGLPQLYFEAQRKFTSLVNKKSEKEIHVYRKL